MRALPRRRHLLHAAAVALLVATAFQGSPASSDDGFHYDASSVDTAAHWAARSTLANAVMFSGLGEPLRLSMSRMDDILRHAGYVTRPPMPDMALVGAVYAAGDPRYGDRPDFGKPATLRWDAASFDRTLDPGAQAWALVKITSPSFHLLYHDRKEDRRAALVMLPQAEAQAEALQDRLRDKDGLFAARSPDGTYAAPKPVDQAAVLWGVSNLILAATSEKGDYWHKAYRELVDPDEYRALARSAFAAVQESPPQDAQARAVAIEALGRYALAAEAKKDREQAFGLARRHADALRENAPAAPADAGFSIYGLIEASRLLGTETYREAATKLFQDRLLTLWSDERGVFVTDKDGEDVGYTPEGAGAIVAGLNAIRWYGTDKAAEKADAVYARFFEAIMVRGRLLRSSPAPLVPAIYHENVPPAHFAHPGLPAPAEAGVAPVFASRITLEGGEWRTTDGTFRSAAALFLSNMLVERHEGEADAFLPEKRLQELR